MMSITSLNGGKLDVWGNILDKKPENVENDNALYCRQLNHLSVHLQLYLLVQVATAALSAATFDHLPKTHFQVDSFIMQPRKTFIKKIIFHQY
jgi:hypothetical protein